MAIVGFWWCSLNSWSLDSLGCLKARINLTWRYIVPHLLWRILHPAVPWCFFWTTCIAQSVDSWLSLRLVINRTALNPEWIRGRLLVQRDELWSNRRRMSCGEILQWAATAWIRMSMFALWICLYDLVCKFILCFHDCSLLSWRFRAQPCGWNSLIHHERDGKVAAMSSFVIIRSMVKLRHWTDLKSVVGDPKRIQKGVISVQFQPSAISAQREGLRCWLWQCFSCSFAVLWDLMAIMSDMIRLRQSNGD